MSRFLSARAYHLGYVSHHGELKLVHRHGTYCVNGWRDGQYVSEGFRTLDQAKRFVRS